MILQDMIEISLFTCLIILVIYIFKYLFKVEERKIDEKLAEWRKTKLFEERIDEYIERDGKIFWFSPLFLDVRSEPEELSIKDIRRMVVEHNERAKSNLRGIQ